MELHSSICQSEYSQFCTADNTINNIIFKNTFASCVNCASLNRAAGLHYCTLLYFITSVIMEVRKYFVRWYKKFENHIFRGL